MAAAVAGGLSSLPDDLLRRILYFTPAKEGASTAVLSRRWRSLWRTSGAINLDSRSYSHFHRGEIAKKTQVFAGDMAAALAATAAEKPVIRKLTLHVEQLVYEINLGMTNSSMLNSLLSSPAAAGGGVEELRFVIADADDVRSHRNDPYGNLAELHFDHLPSESLRVLHVINCSTLIAPPPPAPTTVFLLPRLTELRLQRCGVSLADLQRIVEAAPQLATLHLECYHYTPRSCGIGSDDGSEIGEEEEEVGTSYRIHCPAVTDLVFEACSSLWPWKEGRLELDVPRLEYFRYKGLVHLQNRLSLKLPVSSHKVIQTDLHFVRSDYRDGQVQVRFWEFVQSLNATKVLKLKLDLNNDDHVAMADKGEHLLSNRLFYNLECLDIEVPFEPAAASKACALFIANFLRCCPVVRDLRLKLITRASTTNRTGIRARSDFNKSMDHFRNRRKRSNILLNGEEDETFDEVSDIPGLSDRSFECLQSYLRTVSLQFLMEEPNCFGVQLAKFFAENAMVLEEILIDDGNHKLCEHVSRMLRRWVPGSSKRKNLPTTTAFREPHPRKRQRKY